MDSIGIGLQQYTIASLPERSRHVLIRPHYRRDGDGDGFDLAAVMAGKVVIEKFLGEVECELALIVFQFLLQIGILKFGARLQQRDRFFDFQFPKFIFQTLKNQTPQVQIPQFQS